MNTDAARERFAASDWITRIWPRELRDASLPYFDVQAVANGAAFAGSFSGLDAGIERLDRILTDTELRSPRALAAEHGRRHPARRGPGDGRRGGPSRRPAPAGNHPPCRAALRRGSRRVRTRRRAPPRRDAQAGLPAACVRALSRRTLRSGRSPRPRAPRASCRPSGRGCRTASGSTRDPLPSRRGSGAGGPQGAPAGPLSVGWLLSPA